MANNLQFIIYSPTLILNICILAPPFPQLRQQAWNFRLRMIYSRTTSVLQAFLLQTSGLKYLNIQYT